MNSKQLYFILIFLLLFISNNANAQNPKANWEKYKQVEQAGFSKEKLGIAKTYYDSLNSSAFLIIQNGKMVANWGDINRRFIIHSARKGILNSLFGIYSENGIIDLNKPLANLELQIKIHYPNLKNQHK